MSDLCALLVGILEEDKADDVICIDLCGRHSLFSYIVVASSKTERHSLALVNNAIKTVKEHTGRSVNPTEGSGNWTSVDFGDVVLHVFLPEVRRYYDIEGIWNKNSAQSSLTRDNNAALS